MLINDKGMSIEVPREQVDAADSASDNYHAPQMQILHGYIVICRGPQCGIIGVREKKEQAEAIKEDHRRTHNEVNDRIKAVLGRLQQERAFNALEQTAKQFEVEMVGSVHVVKDDEPADEAVPDTTLYRSPASIPRTDDDADPQTVA